MYMTALLLTLKYKPWRGVHRKASVCYTAVYKTKLLLGSTVFMRARGLRDDLKYQIIFTKDFERHLAKLLGNRKNGCILAPFSIKV